jgi:hypothetical protein
MLLPVVLNYLEQLTNRKIIKHMHTINLTLIIYRDLSQKKKTLFPDFRCSKVTAVRKFCTELQCVLLYSDFQEDFCYISLIYRKCNRFV